MRGDSCSEIVSIVVPPLINVSLARVGALPWPFCVAIPSRGENAQQAASAYFVRTGGKLGLVRPRRTFPLSAVFCGVVRTGGKLGLVRPMRTRSLSATVAGVVRMPENTCVLR